MSLFQSQFRRRQPAGIVGINWGHPIARGMTGAWAANSTAPLLNVATMRRSLVPSSASASVVPSGLGSALKLASSAYFRDTGFSTAYSTTMTMCCWVRPASLPASEQEVMVWTSADTTDTIEQIAVLSGANTKFTNYHSGSNGTATSTATLSVDTWQFLAGVTYAANSRAVFVGTEKTTDTTVSTPLSNATYMTFGAAPWSSYGSNYTGLILLPMIWNRALPDNEIAAIRANPWQLFMPEPRRIYSFSAVAGDVTLSLSGLSMTASAGTPVANSSIALSGLSATTARGTLVPGTSIALSGLQLTASGGTVTPETGIFVGITGLSMTASYGTLSPALSVSLSGNAMTISGGTVTASGGSIWTAVPGTSSTWTPQSAQSTSWTLQ